VRARRRELRISQEDIRAASGLSITTIGKIENGDAELRVQRATMRRLDQALQWPVGTCESWYMGRGGITAATVDHAALVSELAPLVAAQLRDQRQNHSLSVVDLPAEIVTALEQLVAAIRYAIVNGG
jgi:transcriptional regulator with XRE-family HTH domain